ncbi:hypothetical protein FXO37_17774 [Capsicum annuum]|nr:hypothetical protein FXO37_17774 [Capsicum annuum]
MRLPEMVCFRNYTSSSSKRKYLLIEVDYGMILTRLLTDTQMAAGPIIATPQEHGEEIPIMVKSFISKSKPDNVQVLEDPHQSNP